jgi:hypothetical protein
VGTVLNPRRGETHQNDLMLADFLITDPDIIEAILNDEIREVSSGYDCDYEEIGPGRGRQTNIIGNHVALVDKGRCGPRCAIGDHEMKRKDITPTVRQLLGRTTALDRMRTAFQTKDEEAFQNALAEVISGDEEAEVHASGELEEIQELLGELCADADERNGCTSGDAGICTVMKDGKIKDSYKKSMDRRMKDRKVRDEAEAKEKEKADKEAADQRMRDAANGEEESEREENAEEREEEKARDKKRGGKDAAMTTDSKALEGVYRETLSYAEILAPGIRFPTFDGRANAKLTQDALCMLRRRSLEKALGNDDVSPIIRSFTGDSPGIKDLKCGDIETMFRGAAELVKQHNTRDGGRSLVKTTNNMVTNGGPMKTPTIAEINKRNREFHAAREAK